MQSAAAKGNTSSKTALEKIQRKVALKVSEVVGKLGEDLDSAKQLNLFFFKLHRGSFYGENGLVRKAGISRPAAISGYFELFNKSREVIAVKLMASTDNAKFELPRPSYTSIAPGDAVYAFFDSREVAALDLALLFDNPHSLASDRAILYDTRAHGAHPDRLSPCARIYECRQAFVYRIACEGRNVVLKYKGHGEAAPRQGTSVGRVGFFGRLQGRRFAEHMLDLSTNVQAAPLDFRISALDSNGSSGAHPIQGRDGVCI